MRTEQATRQTTDQSYRLEPFERFVARIARAPLWQRTSLSAFVSGGIILFLTFYGLAVRYEIHADPLVVDQRGFGSPGAAIDRIRDENFISITELEELSEDSSLDRVDQMAFAHAPLILDDLYDARLERADDVPIGVYYTYSVATYGQTELVHIEYWMYFSDENIGMSSSDRLARWGHTLDRELIYRLNILNGSVFGAEYQAPIHQLREFEYPEGGRPIFRVASGNHNFHLVQPAELEQSNLPVEVLAPLPQYEQATLPLADPDIMALASQEAFLQHETDWSHYVYVGIQDPAYVLQDPFPAVVDVAVLTQGRWNYLHSAVGHGVVIWGFRLVAIDVGYSPSPGDIEAVKLIVTSHGSSDRPQLEVAQVFLYPELKVPT